MEKERLLPIASVSKISKSVIPENSKVSQESKVSIQECATEFISFLTSQAVDDCIAKNKKTVTGSDIVHAMYKLGFDFYGDACKIYLEKYRESNEIQESNENENDHANQES